MRREVLAGLALTVLLFGSAYLAAGDGAVQEETKTEQTAGDAGVTLRVLEDGTVKDMTLEKYLQGVVRGEMPASFEMEALKAQAAAERTYVYYQLAAGRKEKHPEADVCTDHTCCSAFLSEQAAREKWGGDYDPWEARIEQAVAETDGQAVLYGGQPILAVFHSSSAGKTAAAEDVWSGELPYLKSVDSKGDRQAPNNETTVTIAAKALAERLGIAEDAAVSVKKRTEAGYVAEVQAGSKTFSGREIRERLGLRSADFTIAKNGDSYIFTVHGYGHGAGMSQYGASFLAEQGKNYHEILRHYYTGISFSILE